MTTSSAAAGQVQARARSAAQPSRFNDSPKPPRMRPQPSMPGQILAVIAREAKQSGTAPAAFEPAQSFGKLGSMLVPPLPPRQPQSAAANWPVLRRFIARERAIGVRLARNPWTSALYEFVRFGMKQ